MHMHVPKLYDLYSHSVYRESQRGLPDEYTTRLASNLPGSAVPVARDPMCTISPTLRPHADRNLTY